MIYNWLIFNFVIWEHTVKHHEVAEKRVGCFSTISFQANVVNSVPWILKIHFCFDGDICNFALQMVSVDV